MLDSFIVYIIVIVFFLILIFCVAYYEVNARTVYMEKTLECFENISKSLDIIAKKERHL